MTYTLFLNEVYDGQLRARPHDGVHRTAVDPADARRQAIEADATSFRLIDARGETYFFARAWDGFHA